MRWCFWNNELATKLDQQAARDRGHHLPRPRPAVPAAARTGRSEYLREMELTLTGVEAGQPGLILQAGPRAAADHHARHRRTATA